MYSKMTTSITFTIVLHRDVVITKIRIENHVKWYVRLSRNFDGEKLSKKLTLTYYVVSNSNKNEYDNNY